MGGRSCDSILIFKQIFLKTHREMYYLITQFKRYIHKHTHTDILKGSLTLLLEAIDY